LRASCLRSGSAVSGRRDAELCRLCRSSRLSPASSGLGALGALGALGVLGAPCWRDSIRTGFRLLVRGQCVVQCPCSVSPAGRGRAGMGDGAGTASRWTGFTLVALVGGDRAGFAPRVSGSSREKDVGKVPGCRPAPGAATATRWPPTSSTSCPGSLDRRVERPPLGRGAAAAAGRPRRGAAAAAGRPTRAWLRCLAPASPCESEGEEGDGPDDQALFHVKQLVQVGPPSWASGPPLRSPALSRETRHPLPSAHACSSSKLDRRLERAFGGRLQATSSVRVKRANCFVAVHVCSSSKLDRRVGRAFCCCLQLPSPVRVNGPPAWSPCTARPSWTAVQGTVRRPPFSCPALFA